MFTSEECYGLLRALHIAAGTLTLGGGVGAMVTRKGALWHRRWGKSYFWAMAAIAATSLIMSLMHGLVFLRMVALFSFYLCFAGYRALYVRKVGQRAATADYIAIVLALFAAAGFVWWSLEASGALRVVARVFSGIPGVFAVADAYRYLRPSPERMAWRYAHMSRMLGAFIATVTAFAVVNLQFLPPLVIWLTPTVVGTVGITFWITYYKFQDARRAVHRRILSQG